MNQSAKVSILFRFVRTVLFLTPAAGVISWYYLNYQPDTSPVVRVNTVEKPQVTVLAYPDFGPLKDILKLEGQKTETVYTSPSITSDVVASKRPTQEQGIQSLDNLDLSALSPELAKVVQSAILDTAKYDPRGHNQEHITITPLVGNERRFQDRLPALNFQTHMYASSNNQRRVKVNGKELKEGDWVNDTVMIDQITPRTVVVDFSGQKIEIPALYEWY